MKKLLLILLFLPFILVAQTNSRDILLKSGKIRLEKKFNISPEIIEIIQGDYYRFIQFSEIPSEEQKDILVEHGIKFLAYIPFNTYVVSVSTSFSNIEKLREFGAIALQSILPKHKIDPKIQNKKYPEWALKNGKLSIKVLLYKNADLINFKQKNSQYNIISNNKIGNSLILEINPNDLIKVATINDVWYIEPIDPPSIKENKTGRTLHRSNTINTNYASGRHYNGEGINIMMQDDGLVGPHIDRQGRVDQSFCTGCSSSLSNDHGDHVSGTIMGAGNLDPLGKGMADGAFLYVYSSSNNNYYDVPTIYQNNDVIITSKSYSNGCNAGYTSLARDLDEQINLYPSLIHVFSAGNSGSSDCGYGAGSGWGNVTGGHKQAKNVIAVANLSLTGSLSSSSSRGPAHDGRIKPDIGAKGTSVYSPVSPYTYATYTGTSMACPGIAGIMAQLYQAYKDLNTGQNPSSALMKCLLLNSADDIGNAGPDFKHGWGEVNAYRAVKILEDNQYFSSSVSQSGNNFHSITVPSGTKKIKVMVYWHDKEASVNSSIALVNDINITLTTPTSSTYNPWVLDYTPNATNLNQPATRGIDDRNNMEQLTITNPSSGSYTLNINGFAIPFGPQEYWVTYEFLTDDVQLTYPIGGEGLVSGESEYIRWDAHGTSGNFTLEYSINSGANWSTITTSASGNTRHYIWTVPNNTTANTLVRVSRNGYSDQSDATFTIINVPQNVSVNWLCPDSIYVSWSAVSGATSYEVSMLGQRYMDSMTTTNNLTALITNPTPAITDSWFSVCAKVNNGKGRRAVAVNAQPLNPGCVGYGCTDPNAYNYDPTAIYDNGTCIYCNTNLPYTENFNIGIGSWTNTGSAGNWSLNSGGTPSSNTGPTDDVTGGGNYMYIESSSPNYPNVGPFTLTSECFDLSGSSNLSLSFYYNMYGSAMGTLNVYANNSLIWTLNGNQGQGWNLVQIPLTSIGNALIIEFEGTTGSSWAGDIAIDNISITDQNLILGCTDSTAINYDSTATINDGSCLYPPTIFCDDFESYSNGSYLAQSSSNWTTWSGTGSGTIEDVQITNVLSNSPSNSIFFNGTGSGGGPQDVVLPFGSSTPYTSGYFNFSAEFYVVNGAYFNFQADNMPGNIWALDVIMDNGTINFGHYSGTWTTLYLTSTYPINQWFELNIEVNLNSNSWVVFIDGVSQGTFTNSTNQIASLDLYPLSGHQFYVDDVCYVYSTTPINTSGCTDPLACNYDPLANTDDGSCAYASSSTDSQVHCDAYTWIDGTTYTSSNNTATHILVGASANGCDSVVTLDLTINYSNTGIDLQVHCDSYTWVDGITYTASNNSATYMSQTINGCDSLVTLDLTINYSNTGSTSVTACNSYSWNSQTITTSGNYNQTFTNANGCDSVHTLVATINYDNTGTYSITACDSYTWVDGITYTTSNNSAIFLYPTIHGCDSLVTLNLTINYSNSGSSAVTACDSYTWDGTTYTTSGTYTYTSTNANGCDSTTILNLTINPSTTSTSTQTACNSWYWNGTTYTQSGTYTYSTTNSNGCDSTATLNLTITVCGCTDSTALNYNPLATIDDGSCVYCVYGCMDITQLNYNPLATCDDGNCIPIIYGCMDTTALNYYSAANVDDGTCVYCVYGCTDPLATNYNSSAICDDGSCAYGCGASITGLFMSDVIHDRATFNFDNMNTANCIVDQLRIKYSGDGGATWSQKNMGSPTGYNNGVCNSTQRTDKIATGLSASTTYQWQMKVWYCSTGATAWVNGPNFTTEDLCPNVINFTATPVNTVKVNFSWDTTAAYSFVRIKLRVDTTNASWLSAGGFGVNYPALSKQKGGLSLGETYRGQARTWCNPTGGAYRSTTWTSLVFWTQPTSIKIEGENTAITNLEVYPNPSRDIFNITFTSNEKQDLEIRILNVIGEEVFRENKTQFNGQYTKQINLGEYPKAIYFLEIETDDGVINKKLILQ